MGDSNVLLTTPNHQIIAQSLVSRDSSRRHSNSSPFFSTAVVSSFRVFLKHPFSASPRTPCFQLVALCPLPTAAPCGPHASMRRILQSFRRRSSTMRDNSSFSDRFWLPGVPKSPPSSFSFVSYIIFTSAKAFLAFFYRAAILVVFTFIAFASPHLCTAFPKVLLFALVCRALVFRSSMFDSHSFFFSTSEWLLELKHSFIDMACVAILTTSWDSWTRGGLDRATKPSTKDSPNNKIIPTNKNFQYFSKKLASKRLFSKTLRFKYYHKHMSIQNTYKIKTQ